MIQPYAENPAALFGQSAKSGIAEIMPAIMGVSWVVLLDTTGSIWTFLVNRNPKRYLPTEEVVKTEADAKKIEYMTISIFP